MKPDNDMKNAANITRHAWHLISVTRHQVTYPASDFQCEVHGHQPAELLILIPLQKPSTSTGKRIFMRPSH
jgi:hypothetical protein